MNVTTVTVSAYEEEDYLSYLDAGFPHFFWVPFLSIIALLTIVGNLLIIFSVLINQRLQVISFYLILNLAVSNLLTGIGSIGGVINMVELIFEGTIDPTSGRILQYLLFFLSVTSSSCAILLISIDRYILVVHCLKYDLLVTKPRVAGAVLFSWLACFAYLLWSSVNLKQEHVESPRIFLHVVKDVLTTAHLLTLFIIFYIIPVTVTIYIYVKIYHISRKHQRQIESLSTAVRQLNQVAPLPNVDSIIRQVAPHDGSDNRLNNVRQVAQLDCGESSFIHNFQVAPLD